MAAARFDNHWEGSDPAAHWGREGRRGSSPGESDFIPKIKTTFRAPFPTMVCGNLQHPCSPLCIGKMPLSCASTRRKMHDDEDARRDKLTALENGLCDLQILAIEAEMEMTSALLRMAILDVRQAMGFPRKLDG